MVNTCTRASESQFDQVRSSSGESKPGDFGFTKCSNEIISLKVSPVLSDGETSVKYSKCNRRMKCFRRVTKLMKKDVYECSHSAKRF